MEVKEIYDNTDGTQVEISTGSVTRVMPINEAKAFALDLVNQITAHELNAQFSKVETKKDNTMMMTFKERLSQIRGANASDVDAIEMILSGCADKASSSGLLVSGRRFTVVAQMVLEYLVDDNAKFLNEAIITIQELCEHQSPCVCTREYTDREMTDPNCDACNGSDFESAQDLVKRYFTYLLHKGIPHCDSCKSTNLGPIQSDTVSATGDHPMYAEWETIRFKDCLECGESDAWTESEAQ